MDGVRFLCVTVRRGEIFSRGSFKCRHKAERFAEDLNALEDLRWQGITITRPDFPRNALSRFFVVET